MRKKKEFKIKKKKSTVFRFKTLLTEDSQKENIIEQDLENNLLSISPKQDNIKNSNKVLFESPSHIKEKRSSYSKFIEIIVI